MIARDMFGTFSSGGCLDAIASMLTGFKPLWGTEICERKRAAWHDLTDTPDMGDTYAVQWDHMPTPDIIWSGQTCVDYSLSGPRTGADGETGWMFVEQVKPIMKLQPKAVIIEMVANALNINGGREVRQVCEALSRAYHVHKKVVRVRDYGDESNRERLILVPVCLHHSLGEHAQQYRFPKAYKDNGQCARDLADPDEKVPRHLWRRLNHCHVFGDGRKAQTGRLHKLAQLAPGMGHSNFPHSIYSWDGTFNTMTTHNGGGVRLRLDWKPGQPITQVRKTTTAEARRIASLPESYDQWIRTFDRRDRFVYESINMGVPIGTARAINESIQDTLAAAGVPRTRYEEYQHLKRRAQQQHAKQSRMRTYGVDVYEAPTAGNMCYAMHVDTSTRAGTEQHSVVRSFQLDTGADTTLVGRTVRKYLKRARKSMFSILVADGNTPPVEADVDGDMPVMVLNTPQYDGMPEYSDMDIPVTVLGTLRRSLFSIHDYYKEKGYEVYLRQPQNGPAEITDVHTGGNTCIPLRHGKEGSFWIDYIPIEEMEKYCPDPEQQPQWLQQQLQLMRHKHELSTSTPPAYALAQQHTYDKATADHLHERCVNHAAVKEVIVSTPIISEDGTQTVRVEARRADPPIYATHPLEREIRGVKQGLRDKKRRMTMQQFHEEHGHIGLVPNCKVCRMVKGAM